MMLPLERRSMCCGRSLLNEERRIENGELRMKNGNRGDRWSDRMDKRSLV